MSGVAGGTRPAGRLERVEREPLTWLEALGRAAIGWAVSGLGFWLMLRDMRGSSGAETAADILGSTMIALGGFVATSAVIAAGLALARPRAVTKWVEAPPDGPSGT